MQIQSSFKPNHLVGMGIQCESPIMVLCHYSWYNIVGYNNEPDSTAVADEDMPSKVISNRGTVHID